MDDEVGRGSIKMVYAVWYYCYKYKIIVVVIIVVLVSFIYINGIRLKILTLQVHVPLTKSSPDPLLLNQPVTANIL